LQLERLVLAGLFMFDSIRIDSIFFFVLYFVHPSHFFYGLLIGSTMKSHKCNYKIAHQFGHWSDRGGNAVNIPLCA